MKSGRGLEKQNAEELKFPENTQSSKLSKSQRTAVVFLGIFSFLVLILMVVQLRHSIYSPFDYPTAAKTTMQTLADEQASAVTSGDYSSLPSDPMQLDDAMVQYLQNKDTDNDGLSDYDELYVYHTSPFLEDTDGDGISDAQEIKNGTDPNCPEGQMCNNSMAFTSSTVSGETVTPELIQLDTSTPSASDSNLQSLLSGSATDPATLRQMLLDSGMDKATLDKISDADLLQSYQDTLIQQSNAQ